MLFYHVLFGPRRILIHFFRVQICSSYNFCHAFLLLQSQSCLHSLCLCNSPWLHIFLLAQLEMWCRTLASARLHFQNIKLIADSHGDFAHPFLSLGNNCSSVSVLLLSDLFQWGGDCTLLLPEMLYPWEEGSLSMQAKVFYKALMVEWMKWSQ